MCTITITVSGGFLERCRRLSIQNQCFLIQTTSNLVIYCIKFFNFIQHLIDCMQFFYVIICVAHTSKFKVKG